MLEADQVMRVDRVDHMPGKRLVTALGLAVHVAPSRLNVWSLT
jgi:hypothetical protein